MNNEGGSTDERNIPIIKGGQRVEVDENGLGHLISEEDVEVVKKDSDGQESKGYFYKSEPPVVRETPDEVDPEESVYAKKGPRGAVAAEVGFPKYPSSAFEKADGGKKSDAELQEFFFGENDREFRKSKGIDQPTEQNKPVVLEKKKPWWKIWKE